MKPARKHPEKALTAVTVRTMSRPGRFADGNGLYLVVDPSGAKRWMLRTVVHDKRRDIGLGGLRLVSLADAREKAAAYRKLARGGGDPLAEQRRSRATIPTFEAAARSVHKEHSVTWRNPKHRDQWLNTLIEHVFPVIGSQRVDHIQTPDVLKVLSQIWLDKPETARRIRQRVGVVLDWAKAAGFRSGENPVDGVGKGLPRQPERANHHAALPYGKVPEFIRGLRQSDTNEVTRLAFEYLILTASRTSEVVSARWSEVDLDNAVWTIPKERMKSGRPHRVPLSARCIEILHHARKLNAEHAFVFPGRGVNVPLSNMAFLMALRRLEQPITAHGFRSSFRDWASERTNFPREACELALAHVIKDKTESAYRRGDLLDKRRQLMDAWAAFAAAESAEVIRIPTPSHGSV